MTESFTPLTSSKPSLVRVVEARTAFLWGSLGFLILTAILVYTAETGASRDTMYFVLSCYLAVHVFNSIAAYLLFTRLYHSFWHITQIITLCVIYAGIVVFALLSSVDLFHYALDVFNRYIFDPSISRLFGPDGEWAPIIWLIILPLQVILWLLLAGFTHIVSHHARKHGRTFLKSGHDLQTLYLFVLVAIAAVCLMAYVLWNDVISLSFF